MCDSASRDVGDLGEGSEILTGEDRDGWEVALVCILIEKEDEGESSGDENGWGILLEAGNGTGGNTDREDFVHKA